MLAQASTEDQAVGLQIANWDPWRTGRQVALQLQAFLEARTPSHAETICACVAYMYAQARSVCLHVQLIATQLCGLMLIGLSVTTYGSKTLYLYKTCLSFSMLAQCQAPSPQASALCTGKLSMSCAVLLMPARAASAKGMQSSPHCAGRVQTLARSLPRARCTQSHAKTRSRKHVSWQPRRGGVPRLGSWHP
jgi:hypothetical protein